MKNKRITITGGKGFLGKHLIKALQDKGYTNLSIAAPPEYNLIKSDDVKRLYTETKPHIVIHLAAKVGGIGFNRENPGALFYDNIMMGVQLIHEGYRHPPPSSRNALMPKGRATKKSSPGGQARQRGSFSMWKMRPRPSSWPWKTTTRANPSTSAPVLKYPSAT